MSVISFRCVPSPNDPRDHIHDVSQVCSAGPVVVTSADLRPKMPRPVFNQLSLGSCVANATGLCFRFLNQKMTPSRLFIYYETRKLEGTIDQDSGCCIRDALKVLSKIGVCREAIWPYDITKFRQVPTANCYKQAPEFMASEYVRVPQTATALEAVLREGWPIVCGIRLYDSFMSDAVRKTGVVPMPDTVKEKVLGGHAVCLVGYDSVKGVFRLQNSWGASWGNNGFFELPYAYLLNPNLSYDHFYIKSLVAT